jgi:hypothetical protein
MWAPSFARRPLPVERLERRLGVQRFATPRNASSHSRDPGATAPPIAGRERAAEPAVLVNAYLSASSALANTS